MRKNIAMICVSLAAALAAQGCIDTKLDMTGRSFKELCEISGGEVDQDYPMQCRCGSEDKKLPCVAGVVCMTDPKDDRKKICANDKIEGTLCDPNDTSKRCELSYELECKNIGGEYRWTGIKECDFKSCKDSYTCAECENNTLRCPENEYDNSRLDICVNGKWELSSYCETGLCISDGDGKAKCAECRDVEHSIDGDADTKCVNDALYTCEAGKWGTPENCTYNIEKGISYNVQPGEYVSCNLTGDNCGVCKNGSVYCENDGKYICQNGEWSAKIDCINGNSCVSSTSCGECENGTDKCEDDMYFVCNNGNWIPQESCGEFECSSNDKVCAECRWGDIKCENDETGKGNYRICNEYGLWEEEPIPCGEDVSCAKDLCSSASGECHAETVCGECLNNTQYCQAEMENDEKIAKQYNCVNGNLQTFTCEAGICNSDNTACAECKPDSTKCENDAKSVCNSDGTWGEANPCTYESDTELNGVKYGDSVSCNGDTCGVCKDNESSYCQNDEQSGYGMRTMCEGGIWSVPVQCGTPEFPKKCLSLTSCGECQDGEEKCDNGVYKICEDGNWRVEHECALSCKENKNENGNVTIECYDCKPNDVKCENKVKNGIPVGEYSVCSSEGKWQTAIDCKFTCHAEYCSGCSEIENLKDIMCNECNTGEVQCTSDETGARLEVCRNGQWEFSSYCESGKCKVGEEKPITCEPVAQVLCFDGMTKCEDNKIYRCENYEWIKTENECDETKACVDGEVLSCTNSYDGYGNLIVCRDGTYKTEPCHIDYDPSKPKSSCSNEKSCGECLSGWYNAFAPGVEIHYDNKCVMPNPQICINGLWKSVDRVECKPCEEPDNSTLNKDEFQSKKHPYLRCVK